MRRFDSPAAMAAHLARLAAAGPAVVHHMADRAGREIEVTAKGIIGFYQPRVGRWPAWAPLAESTEAEKERSGYERGAPLLRTGQMRDTIVRSVEGGTVMVGATDAKAIYHELGTRTIPPRPFMGPAAFQSMPRINLMLGNTLAAWVGGASWMRPARRIK